MKNVKIAFIALTVVVALITLFIRIPLPSRGYFNFGDVAVVFSGLVLGSLTQRKNFWWGAGAGGIGSALADVIGGFGLFAPITLIAKGAEGGLCALASGRHHLSRWVLIVLGGVAMVACYFIAEALMPNIGLQGAVSEIIPNLIQAGGGIAGGVLAFTAYQKIVKDD
ncbi:MAG: ECF transporter S component [Deltaproteobacteria bacterium]|jgi:uncharacterized membrane protein|nr:ECF transporter S component [Deltaproteobacteria bacterium]